MSAKYVEVKDLKPGDVTLMGTVESVEWVSDDIVSVKIVSGHTLSCPPETEVRVLESEGE